MSLDDSMEDWESEPPIACSFCADQAFKAPIAGFLFDDLRTCPQCKLVGCAHWCDGETPCEWCQGEGPPPGYFEK